MESDGPLFTMKAARLIFPLNFTPSLDHWLFSAGGGRRKHEAASVWQMLLSTRRLCGDHAVQSALGRAYRFEERKDADRSI